MASAVSIPECGVCHKPYKYGGPAPYLLPCLHSVCEICLDSDVDDAVFCSPCDEYFLKFENNFPQACHECLSQADAGSLCTECSQEPRKLGLVCPKDAVTSKELFATTAEHLSSELLCTNRNDGNQAMSWCQECNAFLCEHCQASHEDMKATRNHAIVLVKDLALSDMERYTAQDQCSVHGGYPKEVYDQNCKILICYKCSKTKHKDCIIQSLEERIMMVKGEKIENQIKALTEKVEKNTETEQTLQRIETILDKKKTELDELVKHAFGGLKCRLDQREEEIKCQLNHCLDHLRKENAEHLRKSRADRKRCKTALEFSEKSLTISSPSSVFEMETTIDNRNTACLSAELPVVRSEATSVSFSRQELHAIGEMIDKFGGFYTGWKDGANETQKTEYVYIPKNKVDELLERECIQQAEIASLRGELSSHEHLRLKENKILSGSGLRFDTRKANKAKVHINSDLKLVNSAAPSQPASAEDVPRREEKKPFANFSGTTSTRPLSRTDVEYWEVHINIDIIKKLLDWNWLFEIGICDETKIDKFKVRREPDSVVLYLRQCKTHNTMCVKVRKDVQSGKCFQQSILNTPGITGTLKYGILTNPKRNQCTFFDLSTNRVLWSCNGVNFSKTYWPIFAVYSNNFAKVEMSCVPGDNSRANMILILASLL